MLLKRVLQRGLVKPHAGHLTQRRWVSLTSTNGEVEVAMKERLTQHFGLGTRAAVADVSGGCGSAYSVEVESPFFENMSRIEQARAVHKILEEQISGMHSIKVKTKAVKHE